MSGVAAVILAGGRGERLGGVTKANLVVGGQPLLERVSAALGGIEVILVAHGPIDPAALGLWRRQHVPIPDLPADYAGPLAGLAAAVDWALAQPEPPQTLLLAAVDTPFLPPDYASRLLAGLAAAPAAVATFEDQPYPTSSAWQLDAIRDLPARVRAGAAPHSLKRLAEALGAATVPFPPHAGGDPFANANTPGELLTLQLRAIATPVR
jgi:molybdopterin-guanine dinucleotide biosynthesis protein A